MIISTTDFLNGLFSLLFVSISIIVGLKISLKYFKTKKRVFCFIGLGWVGICSPWWLSSISFVLVLISGKGLAPHIYFLIGITFIHFFITIYLIGITDLIYKDKQKIIIGLFIFIIIGIFYEIYAFINLFSNPDEIGTLKGLFDVTYKSITMLYLLFCMIVVFITRLLLISGSILFYFGFLLPNFIKKRLSEEI